MATKRGRLSSIDLLPEEAWPHVRAAIDALNENRRSQDDIREELNTHLLALDCNPVSRSAFNRRSLALAKIGEGIRQAREMATIFAEKLDDMPEGDVGMLINEMCKVIIYTMTEKIALEDLETTAKMMKEISLSVYRLEQAGSISTKRRQQIVNTANEKASAVIETVAKERGLSRETAEDIKAKILGIAKPQ
jgi:hypothetical protein